MNTPGLAPGCLEHLDSIKDFFRTPPRQTRFGSFYRKLPADRYNLLIRPDAKVIEIGCGTGELLNGLNAAFKVGVDLSPSKSSVVKSDIPISICVSGLARRPCFPRAPLTWLFFQMS